MKTLVSTILLIMIISSCKQNAHTDNIGTAAIHFADVFITENIPATPTFRVKGKQIVKSEGDSIYFITGSVEGFTSFNVPVSIKHFSETLHYFGGDPNERKNWECLEIYISDKKIK